MRLNDLAKAALESYEDNVMTRLCRDDTIYVWVYTKDGVPEEVEVNLLNHSPEGIECCVEDLETISEWWNDEWSYGV